VKIASNLNHLTQANASQNAQNRLNVGSIETSKPKIVKAGDDSAASYIRPATQKSGSASNLNQIYTGQSGTATNSNQNADPLGLASKFDATLNKLNAAAEAEADDINKPLSLDLKSRMKALPAININNSGLTLANASNPAPPNSLGLSASNQPTADLLKLLG
jgi:hypothetical protein